ncbi:MAG: type VI secretion lipoprotein TssJ [Desulfofustis sp.]|jgi:type VI secretion system VasD/TssJ family lipoprotein|nr:type VI secretion lipoprotein TssJ [Desulfofustis sp.]
MKRLVTSILAAICLVIIFGCSGKKPPPPQPQWLFERDAITIRFKSDRVLNMHEGSPHTLMVCVYQLRDEGMLGQLATNEDGVYQLLDCEPFDSSVRSSKRLIIHPDQDLTVVMDRLADTQKLAFVAGYSMLQKERILRIVDIPVLISKDEKSAIAAPLKVMVNLGSEQIAAIQSY